MGIRVISNQFDVENNAVHFDEERNAIVQTIPAVAVAMASVDFYSGDIGATIFTYTTSGNLEFSGRIIIGVNVPHSCWAVVLAKPYLFMGRYNSNGSIHKWDIYRGTYGSFYTSHMGSPVYPDDCYALELDSQGNLYAVVTWYFPIGNHPVYLIKITPEGVLDWSYELYPYTVWANLAHHFGLTLDGNDNIYATGYNRVVKLSPSGEELWSTAVVCCDVAYDHIYDGVYVAVTGGIRWLRASDGLVDEWTYDEVPGPVYGVAVDPDGDVVAVGARTDSKSVWKVDASSGLVLWSYDTGNAVVSVDIGSDYNIYVAGVLSNDNRFWALSPSGGLRRASKLSSTSNSDWYGSRVSCMKNYGVL